MNIVPLLLGVAVIIGIVILFVGIRFPYHAGAIEDRLQEAINMEPRTLEELEMEKPFSERVIFPMLKRLGEAGNRLFPRDPQDQLRKKLDKAGYAGKLEPGTIFLLQAACLIVFGGLGWAALYLVNLDFTIELKLAITGGLAFIGFAYPRSWLNQKIARRQKSIRLSMPDALDLLTICVEAGLGFDLALAKVVGKWQNDLSVAFGRALKEMQLGKSRREALKAMAERIDIPEMTSFIAAIIQSEQLGASMAKILRIQSDQMRLRRRQHAEEEAHKVPVKMLIPMALLIFPSIVILIMAPAAFKLMNSAAGALFK
jgi:tight adherence protein C